MPIGQLAAVHTRKGPSMIRDEDGLLTGYVYIDPGAEDLGAIASESPPRWLSRIRNAGRLSRSRGAGNTKPRSGCGSDCWLIVPLTLALIVLLIRVNTRVWVKTGIVMLAVPFSLSARCGLYTCLAIT